MLNFDNKHQLMLFAGGCIVDGGVVAAHDVAGGDDSGVDADSDVVRREHQIQIE